MGSTRRRFTAEYKAEAVRFVTDGGRSIAEVARNIGVSETSVSKWVKMDRDKRAAEVPVDAELTESERVELMRLRSETKDKDATISELRMQVEFAKKVATWFASHKQ